jgi:hypothetical protein
MPHAISFPDLALTVHPRYYRSPAVPPITPPIAPRLTEAPLEESELVVEKEVLEDLDMSLMKGHELETLPEPQRIESYLELSLKGDLGQ